MVANYYARAIERLPLWVMHMALHARHQLNQHTEDATQPPVIECLMTFRLTSNRQNEES